MNLSRRGFIAGLLAAPIIVRPGILMPIRPLSNAERFVVTGVSNGATTLTMEEFVEHYIAPAVARLEADLKRDFAAQYYADDSSFHRWIAGAPFQVGDVVEFSHA